MYTLRRKLQNVHSHYKTTLRLLVCWAVQHTWNGTTLHCHHTWSYHYPSCLVWSMCSTVWSLHHFSPSCCTMASHKSVGKVTSFHWQSILPDAITSGLDPRWNCSDHRLWLHGKQMQEQVSHSPCLPVGAARWVSSPPSDAHHHLYILSAYTCTVISIPAGVWDHRVEYLWWDPLTSELL